DKAEALAARLDLHWPLEAEMIRGILAWRQNRAEESCRILAAAIRQLRKDPWPMPMIRENTFDAALALSATGPKRASEFWAAFSEPFAVSVADESRRDCACFLAAGGPPETAVPFLETYEPHVTWTKRFLTFRKRIYSQTHHRLARQADLDLEQFSRNA